MNIVADSVDHMKHRNDVNSPTQIDRYNHLQRQLSSFSDVDSETIAILHVRHQMIREEELSLVNNAHE